MKTPVSSLLVRTGHSYEYSRKSARGGPQDSADTEHARQRQLYRGVSRSVIRSTRHLTSLQHSANLFTSTVSDEGSSCATECATEFMNSQAWPRGTTYWNHPSLACGLEGIPWEAQDGCCCCRFGLVSNVSALARCPAQIETSHRQTAQGSPPHRVDCLWEWASLLCAQPCSLYPMTSAIL